MSERILLVTGTNGKRFRVTVPDGAKVTFGPWSPPSGEGRVYGEKALAGTLRVYESAKSGASILGVFSNVVALRDLNLQYEEEVAREEGAILWKSDRDGYKREEKVQRKTEWIAALGDGTDEQNDEETI